MNELADMAPPEVRAMSASVPGHSAALRAALWRPTGLALLFLLVGILLLYRDTAVDMVSIWQRSETFAHGFVVPPIVLWLIWRRRAALAGLAPCPTLWAMLPLAVFALIWLVGDLANLNSVTQFAMTALLVLVTVSVIGLPASRAILFPLAFLFFAVPMGEILVPQLMEWTANVTVFALRLSGVPVFREGLNFVIPSGSWSVVEACSGVRYLIASFMVGTLFARLNYQSTRRRLTFMGVSLLVPIVANWVRAYLIVLLGHVFGNRLAVVVDHLLYGWLFFGVVILTMFWVGAKWVEPKRDDDPTRVQTAFAERRPAMLWAVAAAAALLAAAPHAAKSLIGRVATSQPQLLAPATLSEHWTAVAGKPIEWKPVFVNPSAEIDSAYASEGQHVGLYVGYYRQQDQNRKLVGTGNVLVRSEDYAWIPSADRTRAVDVGGKAMTLRATTLRARSAGRGDLLVWRTYWVNGRFTSNDLVARAEIAFGKLMGRGDDAAVVVLYTTSEGGEKALEAFSDANLSAIEALLRKTSGAQR